MPNYWGDYITPSGEVRIVLYRVYEGKCQYCRQFFLPGEMCIDHIVPRGHLEDLRTSFPGLDNEFPAHEDSLSNFTLSCLRCNLIKGNSIPDLRTLRLWLLKAKDSATEIVFRGYLSELTLEQPPHREYPESLWEHPRVGDT